MARGRSARLSRLPANLAIRHPHPPKHPHNELSHRIRKSDQSPVPTNVIARVHFPTSPDRWSSEGPQMEESLTHLQGEFYGREVYARRQSTSSRMMPSGDI
ncbi:hypothetical protein BC826DRAFT_967428 [Russula brevipes]|nr:hypothetical protein BC826DRAFT_967428 [Russula brevipes]